MSKNERFLRTASAALIFAVIGIFAISNENIGPEGKHARGLAAVECATSGCATLARVEYELLARPGSDSTEDPAAQAAIEKREAKLLREGGAVLVGMFRDAIGSDELEAATRFLYDTFPRDGAGIAIDVLALGLGPEKTAKALAAIEAEVDSLAAEGVLSGDSLRDFKAALAMARSAGGDPGR